MPGNYSLLHIGVDGNPDTAEIRNQEHQNHIDHADVDGCGSAGSTGPFLLATKDPFPGGVPELTSNIRDDIEELRYQINAITGESQWVVPPSKSIAEIQTEIDDLDARVTAIEDHIPVLENWLPLQQVTDSITDIKTYTPPNIIIPNADLPLYSDTNKISNLTITPLRADSIIQFEALMNVSVEWNLVTENSQIAVMLFLDGVETCVRLQAGYVMGDLQVCVIGIPFRYEMPSWGLTPRTYNLSVNPDGPAVTMKINNCASQDLWVDPHAGFESYFRITERAPVTVP